jgi:hypothetical protein
MGTVIKPIQPMVRIISNLHNPEHSDARSATNSLCHCVEIIIGTCTATATKSRGGQTFDGADRSGKGALASNRGWF